MVTCPTFSADQPHKVPTNAHNHLPNMEATRRRREERIAMNSKLLVMASAVVLLFSGLIVIIITPRPRSHLLLPGSDGQLEAIPIEGAFGPESFTFSPQGDGPYTGVSDGRIIKWVEEERRWVNFAYTSPNRQECEGRQDHEAMEHLCGRPLGLGFNHDSGDLYIADAYKGLLVVGPHGGSAAKTVAAQVDGVPFGFANGLDIDQRTGIVYFSDSSSKYHRRDYISLILTGDKTGRLMKYDPQTEHVEVLLEAIAFPNGVALALDRSSILVSETGTCRILRYCLETGTARVFAHLPGFPDNIKRSPRGGYWVGIFTRRTRFLDWVLSNPKVGSALVQAVPSIGKAGLWYAKWRGRGFAVRLSEEGEVLEVLDGESLGDGWKSVSEVLEREVEGGGRKRSKFWVGSVNMHFAGTFLR